MSLVQVMPLVFVHGFMGGSEQWQLQQPLAERRELIQVDLPGFGRNAHLEPIASIEGFAKWVLTELTQKGVERFDLIGHSMGGMIVQEMARLAPARINRLVLYGTGAMANLPGRFETFETSMQRAQEDGPKATARRISATWFHDGEAAAEYPACAAIAEQSSSDAIAAGFEAMRGWSGADNLANITLPTLILWGEHDRTYTWPVVEQLWRSIPNASLAVVPGCAHAVHSENPSLFNMLVDQFLSTG